MRPAALIAWTSALLSAGLAGCHGPELHLQNEAGHPTFVDGRACTDEVLPYRYYGTTRWDALPKVDLQDGIPTFDRLPDSGRVTIEAPSSPWLFPLDFPLELLARALHGRRDVTATVTVREKPAAELSEEQIPPAEIGKLRARAFAARVER